jgi:hypothetical protein
MAAGSGRLDLCVLYNREKYPIELKIWRGKKAREKGIEQTLRYMDIFGLTEGWLAIFDRNTETLWEKKIYMEKHTVNGKTVTIVGV